MNLVPKYKLLNFFYHLIPISLKNLLHPNLVLVHLLIKHIFFYFPPIHLKLELNFEKDLFLFDLARKKWEYMGLIDDLNEKAKIFDSFFKSTLDNHAPVKEIRMKSTKKRSLSEKTKLLMKERDLTRKAISKHVDKKQITIRDEYKKLRNIVT